MTGELESLFSLRDEVIVVTGASGRLGSAYARALLRAGARVAALDVHAAHQTGLPENETPAHFLTIEADVTDRASLSSALDAVTAHLGAPTGLINNAAIDTPPDAPAEENGPFETYPEASWDLVMDANVKGVVQCCQVFGAAMARAGRGSIVNISSIYGLVSPDQRLYDHRRRRGETFYKPIAYSASKSALLNVTRYLATYWATTGVRVNTLTLGGVYAGQDEEFVRAYNDRVPLGRMATADDYVGAVAFLLSGASRYMTGANLIVDGGWTAW